MDRRDFLSGGAGGLFGLYPAVRSSLSECKVSGIDALRTVDPSKHSLAYVEGRAEPGDGAEGLFVWSSEREPDRIDGGTGRGEGALYVRSSRREEGHWFRVVEDSRMNVKWFGATGDGRASDSQAIQDALWTAGTSGVLHTYIPPGTYRITDPIRIADYGSGHVIEGGGILSTKLVKEGSATTELRGEAEADIDACIVLDRFSSGEGLVDFYGTQIRDLSLQGNTEDDPSGPFSRKYGLYVQGGNRLTFERIQFAYFNTAFFARNLWMSTLSHLKAASARQFIVVGGTEEMITPPDGEASGEEGEVDSRRVPASTSLEIANCYCSKDISGTAFLLNKVYYSTLTNCGADNVQGWPYHIKRSRGITIESSGFEWSRTGRGVWFEGARGTVLGLQSFNTHPGRTTTEDTSPLRVSDDAFGRASQVTVISSYLGDFTDENNQWIAKGKLATDANPNIQVTGQSRLVLLDTRIPQNGGDDWGLEESEAQLFVMGGNIAPESLRIQRGSGTHGEEYRTEFGGGGLHVHSDRVVGKRKEAVGKLDQEIKHSYDHSQIQAISDKVDAIIDLLGASEGHGLTED